MKNVPIILITLVLLSSYVCMSNASAQAPQSAVLFITDGLSSHYIYPELDASTQNGSLHESTPFPNLTGGGVARVLRVKVPVPKTGPAHSVIITGNSEATPESVPEEVTIFDVLHEEGFLILGVMEKGDASGMRGEQDAILYAGSNSIYEPVFSIDGNRAPVEITSVMEKRRSGISGYLGASKGAERYILYNRFVIETAQEIVKTMLHYYPEQPFLLIVNAGGLDSAGHHTNYSVYNKVIKGLDADIYGLKRLCEEEDVAFLLTADHGMFFKTASHRGGHAGDDYAIRPESLHIPLVISSKNINTGVVGGEYSQADVAPTLLSVLDIPNMLKGDGRVIPVKSYANLYIINDADYVQLYQGDKLINNLSGERISFKHLEGEYTLQLFKEKFFIKHEARVSSEDVLLNLKMPVAKPVPTQLPTRHAVGIILILVVNIAGILLIKRLKD